MRKAMSRTFYIAHKLLFNTPAHDPSCPFILARKEVIQRLLPELGLMKQGFWWEFIARVHRRGFTMREHIVHHRLRMAGETQVYRLNKLAGIGYHHFLALFQIWRETRR